MLHFQDGDFMKKPLQPRNEFAEAFNNSFARYQGHIQILTGYDEKFGFIYRNTGDLSYLLETVNQALVNRDSKDASFAHQFGLSLVNWLERFLKKGFTTVLSELVRHSQKGNLSQKNVSISA
nr:hypothetical protein HAGR004_15920 [Bdellovibrio sp. HAGR004]BFD66598.1 hypothetical protein HAGR004_16200 [Bdellovibrio sp. HAGR004]